MKRIRISCACLGRICINDNYLLLQNKKMLNKGIVNYSPIGGALEYKPESYDFLISLGAEFEKGKDLRLTIPEENYDKFKEWFLRREGRELEIFREMREELVDEEKFINSLTSSDFTETLVNTIETTHDWDVNGVMQTSYYFFEIFEVRLSSKIENEIKENLKVNGKFFLFENTQINENFNDVIAGSSKYILPQ
jgi:hypothetical protein